MTQDDALRRLATIRRLEAEAAMTPEQRMSQSLEKAFAAVTNRAHDQLKERIQGRTK